MRCNAAWVAKELAGPAVWQAKGATVDVANAGRYRASIMDLGREATGACCVAGGRMFQHRARSRRTAGIVATAGDGLTRDRRSDGTLFALSTAPAGADKNILHYEAGHWTSVPGLTASSIAVGPTGTLYASAPNGVYAYDAGVWKPLGRAGFGGVTAAGDGSIYALGSAADTTGNRVIWRKLGAGLWTRQAATGEFLAASFDQATYAVPGVGAVKPDGYFVVKSTGAISYWLPNGTSVSFPGTASAVAPVPGGFFALQFPLATSGAHLTYFDYATARTNAQTEVARGLAAGHGAGGP